MSQPDETPIVCTVNLPRLSVAGTQLTAGGQPLRLRGVNRSSFQYLGSLAESGMADPREELTIWRNDWGAQIIRFPVFPDRYLREPRHREELEQVIRAAGEVGVYLILEFHGLQPDYQLKLPRDPARQVWEIFARRYGGLAHVAFDLWNEPHNCSWRDWQRAAQPLIDAIRAAGATETLIVVGGLDWAYDLSALSDPGNRLSGGPLAYATHPYPFKGGPAHGRAEWDRFFGNVAREVPVLVTEFGADQFGDGFFSNEADTAAWLRLFLEYVDERGLTALAWSGGDRPHLTLGRDGGRVDPGKNPPDVRTASAPFGEIVRAWLRAGLAVA